MRMTINLFASLSLLLLGTGLLPAVQGGAHPLPSQFSGTIKVFEYGAFISDDGEVYSFRLVTPDAQRPYRSVFLKNPRTEILCLNVEFDGYATGQIDQNRVAIIDIVRFQRIEKTDCA
jgi:hypothetical protein